MLLESLNIPLTMLLPNSVPVSRLEFNVFYQIWLPIFPHTSRRLRVSYICQGREVLLTFRAVVFLWPG